MKTSIGMSQAALDAIELRRVGVDHAPWRIDHRDTTRGDKIAAVLGERKPKKIRKLFERAVSIHKDGKPALKGESGFVSESETFDPMVVIWGGAMSNDDILNFVANAPTDMQSLINEVKFLRQQMDKAVSRGDRAVSDLKLANGRVDDLHKERDRTRGVLSSLKELMGS